MSDHQRLTRRQLFLFGLPDYAVYLAVIPVSLYLPFVYSTYLGIDLATVGIVLMAARLSDVVTDPLIGYLSDRTNTRFGKRKPWLAAGSVVMGVSAWQLFTPTSAVSEWHLLIWAMLLWLGWTMVNIPYFAWGAELSDDYNERTRITGWRQALGYLGNVSALLVPIISGELFGYGGMPAEGIVIVGFMVMVLLPVLAALAVWDVPERTVKRNIQPNLWKAAKKMFKNGSFLLLFVSFLLLSAGMAWMSPLFMLFAKFIIKVEAQTQLILLGYFATNVIALPLWMSLSYRIGKKWTWLCGAFIFVIATPCFLVLEEGDMLGFFLVLALCGLAGGNTTAIAYSMKADLIEVSGLRTGDHLAGSYMAVWSLGAKAANAIAGGVALLMLDWFGFDPKAINDPEALDGLRYTLTMPTTLLYLLAIPIILRFPLSPDRLVRIREAFSRREDRRRGAQEGAVS